MVQEQKQELRRLRNRHVARLCDYIGASNMLADSIKHEFDLFEADVASMMTDKLTRETGDTNHDDIHQADNFGNR